MGNIVFRVDVSDQIGTGHFMRCLTLADSLTKSCTSIRFVCRYLPEFFRTVLRERQYEFSCLTSSSGDISTDELSHSDWLGVSQAVDSQDTLQALSDRTWDWLVVDHYSLDARWEAELRKAAANIMVIDDIADRQHDCDILLDQNFYADMNVRYKKLVPDHCQLLLGPQYALLRNEFSQLRKKVRPRTGQISRILVFFGGMDPNNFTGRVIEELATLGIQGLEVDVVIGVQHPKSKAIESCCAEYGFNCYLQTDRMADLMASADLAIGAGGSATWERCCLGLPTLIVSLADNQTKIARGIELLGAGRFVEINKSEDLQILVDLLLHLMDAPTELKSFSEKAYSTTDGLGVARVCELVMSQL